MTQEIKENFTVLSRVLEKSINFKRKVVTKLVNIITKIKMWNTIFRFYTYIIDHYNPSVRIIDLVSHTTYVVCVNFIHKWRDLLFKVDRYFEKLFMAILFTPIVFSKNLLEGNRRNNTFFVLCFDVWPGAWTLALRLISQHTTY